jgi:hypothetical protein
MKYIVLVDNSEIEFESQEAAALHAASLTVSHSIISEQEREERVLAKIKREFGLYVSNECIELLGARNKILGLTGTQVSSMLSNLMPVKSLLETGALGTARSYMIQLKAAYPNHADVFDDGIQDINEFEAEYGL